MTSDDYKKGWYDGYQAAKNDIKFYEDEKKPRTPTPNPPNWPSVHDLVLRGNFNSCSVCGMSFTNPNGSLKTMGYVCSNVNCPSNIYSSRVSYASPANQSHAFGTISAPTVVKLSNTGAYVTGVSTSGVTGE